MKLVITFHIIEEILDYVHIDVWGPTTTISLGGKRYFIIFIDDYSKRVLVYPMRHKSDFVDMILNWKKMIETQTGKKD